MSADHLARGLLPLPRSVEPLDGHIDLPDGATVRADVPLLPAARWWRRTCEDAFGVTWDLRTGVTTEGDAYKGGQADTVFVLDRGLPPGGYGLDVGEHAVEVRARDDAGAQAAVRTLQQLLGPAAFRHAGTGRVRLPRVRITDSPRCAWRGLLLDVARHFMPKDGVLRIVDLAAAHKLNVLQLHLTDDQGWRIEVNAYPRLTDAGGWREGSGVGTAGRTDLTPHGGFYTQDDLREIVAYAARRGVIVVPEIEVPGHCQAAIAAYPELGMADGEVPVWTGWGVSDVVIRPTEASLAFFATVIDEVVDVFDSPVIGLGGDEVPATRWLADPEVQRQAGDLGLADVSGLHGWFVGRLAAHVSSRGRRASVWDEAMSSHLPADAVVCAWRGVARGTQALHGWDVVLCPSQFVYLDHRAGDGPDEPVPVGLLRTVDDVYGFDPEPPPVREAVAGGGGGRLLGAQAEVWTEHLDSPRRVDFAAFPRLAAFAEAVWTAPGQRDLADFRRRLVEHHLPRLDAAGVEYRPMDGPRPWQSRPGVPGDPRDLDAERAAASWGAAGGRHETGDGGTPG